MQIRDFYFVPYIAAERVSRKGDLRFDLPRFPGELHRLVRGARNRRQGDLSEMIGRLTAKASPPACHACVCG